MSIPGDVHLWDAGGPRRGAPDITAGQETGTGAGNGDARCHAQSRGGDTAAISLKQASRKSSSHGELKLGWMRSAGSSRLMATVAGPAPPAPDLLVSTS